MKSCATKKAAEEIAKRYWSEIDRLAEQVRQTYVIPLCEKERYQFLSGNASWFFYRDCGRGGLVDEDLIPKRVAQELNVEVINHHVIGSAMRNYKPKERK